MDWRAYLAWQLHRSVSCAYSDRPDASRDRGLRDYSRSKGSNYQRRSGERGVHWQSQPKAGGGLRMELWDCLQSEVDQGAYLKHRLLPHCFAVDRSIRRPAIHCRFENQFPGLVERDPTTGVIEQIIDPQLNLTRAIVEGVDYEAIY